MKKLDVGDNAPVFTLASDKGPVSSSSLLGKKVVLFFYPKDDTPGCTKESCEFTDHVANFEKKNAVVYGISTDDVESHKKFSKKYNLGFPLLSDPDHKICEAFGVWGEREWRGQKYMGISRTTFVIDEHGKVAKVYNNVSPGGHAAAVLSDI